MRPSAMGTGIAAVLMLLATGCGDSGSDADNSSDENTRDTEKNSDDDTDSGTDGNPDDSDDDSEGPESTNPEDNNDNTPPDLPSECRLVTESFGGEDVGEFEISGGGDGRNPDIAADPESYSGVVVWGYFKGGASDDDTSRWGIQSASVTTTPPGDEDPTKPALGETVAVTTSDESQLAETPTIARGDDGYGVAYRDTRWDTACDPLVYEDCDRDLAFIAIDENGTPADREPLRLTDSGVVMNRPDIARIPDGGYVIAWHELETDDFYTKVIRIDAEGIPSEIFTLPQEADDFSGPTVASNDTVAVVAYATKSKKAIVAGVWPHDAAEPEDEILTISDQHPLQRSPRIAAGEGGFMVSWNGEHEGLYEIFLHPLDETGTPVGDTQRGTWCFDSVSASDLAWNGETYALVWEAGKVNGIDECAVAASTCKPQVFAALVDTEGEVTTASVRFSDDPNQSQLSRIAWDGVGWTVVWQTWGNLRWRVFYGQMVCD